MDVMHGWSYQLINFMLAWCDAGPSNAGRLWSSADVMSDGYFGRAESR